LKVGTIHIILLFSLLVSLAGCQIQNPSNLPIEDVSQLRVLVPDDGYYQITRKEWEKNGLTVHDLDQINLLYQG
jgi:ribonuclease I